MSEPRYDFVMVVVREKVDEWYVVNNIFVVYSSKIPQRRLDRKTWCQSSRTQREIAGLLEVVYGKIPVLPKGTRPVTENSLWIWGVVPLLGCFGDVAGKVESDKILQKEGTNVLIDTDFVRRRKLQKWFESLYDDFHKLGGGRHLVNKKTLEVSNFAL